MWDNIRTMNPIERKPDGELFRLTPKQARSVRRLVKLCCNNADGDCLLLDDGENCTCPQSIAYTLICKYFRHAVLPAEPELEEGIFHPKDMRRCTLCGTRYIARSGRSKYCPDCAAEVHRKQKTAHARKKRSSVDNYHLKKAVVSRVSGSKNNDG